MAQALTERTRLTRWGQGVAVNRARPHIFHRDYLLLSALHDGVARFAALHRAEIEGGTVLDFGAEHAPYAHLFSARVVPADIGPPRPGLLPLDADGRVPLPDGSVTAVLSTQVLEHVPDVAAYLAEARRVLRPNGLLYLTTHGVFHLHGHPADYWRWTLPGLQRELTRNGFAVAEIIPRIGMLAAATHARAVAFGAMTHSVPLTGWARPLIYLLANLRMLAEERVTPQRAVDGFSTLLLATARKA